MSIEPHDARIAEVSPEIVNRRFKSLGITSWVDGLSGNTLRLIYFGRPAHFNGNDLDVEVKEAGYVWVETPNSPAIAHVVPQPARLVLVFTPQ